MCAKFKMPACKTGSAKIDSVLASELTWKILEILNDKRIEHPSQILAILSGTMGIVEGISGVMLDPAHERKIRESFRKDAIKLISQS